MTVRLEKLPTGDWSALDDGIYDGSPSQMAVEGTADAAIAELFEMFKVTHYLGRFCVVQLEDRFKIFDAFRYEDAEHWLTRVFETEFAAEEYMHSLKAWEVTFADAKGNWPSYRTQPITFRSAVIEALAKERDEYRNCDLLSIRDAQRSNTY